MYKTQHCQASTKMMRSWRSLSQRGIVDASQNHWEILVTMGNKSQSDGVTACLRHR
ncbi:hypothetical protein ACWATR_35825 [Nostoc sp. UIC 10890]